MPIPLGILAVAGAGAGEQPAFEHIATTTVTSSTSSVTFSSGGVWAGYVALRVYLNVKNTTDSTDLRLRTRITSGTASPYYDLSYTNNNQKAWNSITDYYETDNIVPGNTETNFRAVLDIMNINDSARPIAGQMLYSGQGADGFMLTGYDVFYKQNTGIATNLVFEINGANFANKSVFSLYGLKG